MRSFPSGWSKVLAQLGFRRRTSRKPRKGWRHGRTSRIEQLEVRQLLTGNEHTVTTLEDIVLPDAYLSLREAIAAAAQTPGADTINFATPLAGGVLELSS